MKLDAKKIIVTGGAGFIGSHLVDQLIALGKTVTVFDDFSSGSKHNLRQHAKNPKLKVIEGDVRDLRAVTQAFSGNDYVFHLATNCVRLSLTDPKTNHDINATGTLNTLLAAKEVGVSRFIYCSSSEVYGNAATKSGGGLLSEGSEKLPTTVYGASKLVGENYAMAFHETHGLPCLIVRPFNAYGPRSHGAGANGEVIPRFAVLLKAGKAPVIFGDGNQTRDFTYVEDTAAGLIASAGCDALLGDSINIAKGTDVSIRAVAETMMKLTKAKVAPKYIADRPGDIRKLGADVTKSKRLLPHVPTTTLDQGLAKYLEWLDGQYPNYEKLASELTERNWITEVPLRQVG